MENTGYQLLGGAAVSSSRPKPWYLWAIFLALAILIFALWPRDAEIKIADADFAGMSFNVSEDSAVRLDSDLALRIELRNPNLVAVDVDRVTVHIFYHGDELGKIDMLGGRVPPRKTVNCTARLEFSGAEIVRNARELMQDALQEEVPVITTAEFIGNLEIPPLNPTIKATVSCFLTVNPRNGEIIRRDCGKSDEIPLLFTAGEMRPNPLLLAKSAKRILTSWYMIAAYAVLGLIILATIGWLLWPKTPEITLASMKLPGFSANSKFPENSMIPEVILDINLAFALRIRNPNFMGVWYDRITIFVYYYGYELCKAELDGGRIPCRDEVTVDATVDLRGAEIMYNTGQLLADVSRREVPMNTLIQFSGNMAGLPWPHIKAAVGYEFKVDPVTSDILSQDYQLK